MNEPRPAASPAGGYRVVVRGQIDPRWWDSFDQWRMSYLQNGDMLFVSSTSDPAVLHGLLAHIRDLRLELISVARAG